MLSELTRDLLCLQRINDVSIWPDLNKDFYRQLDTLDIINYSEKINHYSRVFVYRAISKS